MPALRALYQNIHVHDRDQLLQLLEQLEEHPEHRAWPRRLRLYIDEDSYGEIGRLLKYVSNLSNVASYGVLPSLTVTQALHDYHRPHLRLAKIKFNQVFSGNNPQITFSELLSAFRQFPCLSELSIKWHLISDFPPDSASSITVWHSIKRLTVTCCRAQQSKIFSTLAAHRFPAATYMQLGITYMGAHPEGIKDVIIFLSSHTSLEQLVLDFSDSDIGLILSAQCVSTSHLTISKCTWLRSLRISAVCPLPDSIRTLCFSQVVIENADGLLSFLSSLPVLPPERQPLTINLIIDRRMTDDSLGLEFGLNDLATVATDLQFTKGIELVYDVQS